MLRDYQIVSPSLEGVLSESTLTYEGLQRPLEVLRVLDGPASKGKRRDDKTETVSVRSEQQEKLLIQYFDDLYRIFMKKLTYFVVESEIDFEETVKLQAMLQEMIKVKNLLGKRL